MRRQTDRQQALQRSANTICLIVAKSRTDIFILNIIARAWRCVSVISISSNHDDIYCVSTRRVHNEWFTDIPVCILLVGAEAIYRYLNQSRFAFDAPLWRWARKNLEEFSTPSAKNRNGILVSRISKVTLSGDDLPWKKSWAVSSFAIKRIHLVGIIVETSTDTDTIQILICDYPSIHPVGTIGQRILISTIKT